MSAVIEATVSTGPLNADHHHDLAQANVRAKKIRKAAKVAAFNGWVTGLFAACSAPFAFFSISGFVVTAGLIAVAYNEFRGRQQLNRFDPSAAARLGWNQVGFLVLIVLYCGWMLFSGLTGESPIAAEMNAKPELAMALGSMDEFDYLYRLLIVAIYGTVILLTVIFQGATALYYFSRRKYVEAYVRETPDWVLDVQRVANSA